AAEAAMKIRCEIAGAAILAALVFVPAILAGQAQGGAPQRTGGARFPDLVGALKATPGVLGGETGRTQSRRQVIFAWFENKKAALTWYYSDTHRSLQKAFAPGSPARTPIADVPDDGRAVMAIASLTMAGTPTAEQPFPVSQIAIELYKPLPGGLAAGG